MADDSRLRRDVLNAGVREAFSEVVRAVEKAEGLVAERADVATVILAIGQASSATAAKANASDGYLEGLRQWAVRPDTLRGVAPGTDWMGVICAAGWGAGRRAGWLWLCR
jgi:hypothetical protein